MKNKRLFSFQKVTMLLAFLQFVLTISIAQEIKIAVVTGGHDFDRPAFFEMFDDMEEVEWVEIVQPEALQMMVDKSIRKFEVLVFYDMYQQIDDKQKKAFQKCQQEFSK